MGLDMFLHAVKGDDFTTQTDNAVYRNGDFTGEEKEIGYWRKVNCIHNWFHKLALEKQPVDGFNCEVVEITYNEVIQLILDVCHGNVEPVTGFFFGPQEVNDEDMLYTLKTMYTALQYIKQGYKIYYSSWW